MSTVEHQASQALPCEGFEVHVSTPADVSVVFSGISYRANTIGDLQSLFQVVQQCGLHGDVSSHETNNWRELTEQLTDTLSTANTGLPASYLDTRYKLLRLVTLASRPHMKKDEGFIAVQHKSLPIESAIPIPAAA